MAEDFDQSAADRKYDDIMSSVRSIRQTLNSDILDYYASRPASDDEARAQVDGIRRYLRVASGKIDDLLGRL